MINGLYTSTAGMLAQIEKQDVITNNLANANTTGFKKDDVVFESFPVYLFSHLQFMGNVLSPLDLSKQPIGIKGQGVQVSGVYTNFKEGALYKTSNPLDLAIQGRGFFTVLGRDSELYTRNGNFNVNALHQIVTSEGYMLMGEMGPIVTTGNDIRIDSDGIVFSDGARIDKLKIVDFQRPTDVRKIGDSLYETNSEPMRSLDSKVVQGYIEGSNVNVIREMIDMISVMRTYEANQRMIITQDAILQKAVNEIARLA